MRRIGIIGWTCACLFPAQAILAQHRVETRHLHERCYAVVPMIGKGTMADPRRPMYAPLTVPITTAPPAGLALPSPVPGVVHPASPTGILGYSYELSDDKKFALVEFVAADRSACSAILGDQTVKTFLKGKDKQEDIEAEFKKQKKDFDFNRFGVRIP